MRSVVNLFVISFGAILLAACSRTPADGNVSFEETTDDQSKLGLPEPNGARDCAPNDAFFADLMKQGYERVVFGFDDSSRDVAVWRLTGRRTSEDQADLVLTVSGDSQACRIIGLDEQSAPPG